MFMDSNTWTTICPSIVCMCVYRCVCTVEVRGQLLGMALALHLVEAGTLLWSLLLHWALNLAGPTAPRRFLCLCLSSHPIGVPGWGDASCLIWLFLRGAGKRTLVIRLVQQGLALAELSPQNLHVCCAIVAVFVVGLVWFWGFFIFI